jgi:hypothetical protein
MLQNHKFMTSHISSKQNRTQSAHLLAHICCTINQPLTIYCIDILEHTFYIISVHKTTHRRHILGYPVNIIAAQKTY